MSTHRNDRRVTACIPYFRCKRYIRRAVVSLLEQSHRSLTVVVINDGDRDAPWAALAGIGDRRLVRFDLPQNRGPYFATAVALNATSTPYFLIQDADDWSAPERVAKLLEALERERTDFAVSAAPQVVERAGANRIIDVRWSRASREREAGNFIVHHQLTPAFKYRAPHHGLYRTLSVKAVGGYYGGLRISYDTLLPNLILMIGTISHVPESLYYRLVRAESLTHGGETGVGSERARLEGEAQRYLYRTCFGYYRLFLQRRLSAARLAECIAQTCRSGVSREDGALLADASAKLATLLNGR